MRGRNRKGPNPLSRSFESNGPDVKIRGTASHIAEKYVTLARDAASSGDRVAEQSYLQHAEHYFRIVAAAQAQMPQPPQNNQRSDDGDGDQAADAGPYGNQPSADASDAQSRANGADGSGEANGHAGNGGMTASPQGKSGNGDGRGRQRGRQSSQEGGTASNADIAVDEDSAPTSSDD
jgi:hypothetical protein